MLVKKISRRRAGMPPEEKVHIASARLLSMALPSYVMWHHTPNGEARNRIVGAKLKRMGVTPGVPDILLYDTRTGYLHAIEFKGPKGNLSEAQKAWRDKFVASPTARYAVSRSVTDTATILAEWWPLDIKVAKVI
jgi:hypothetical protein